ncbi:(2Fe-2S)-binding protein, partial [Streptomyces sp. NPDC059949]|uniref:(2Fe-2S)-binding protein n=1 Tax=Streptomyces sp. NPDC059949 TaxID=3347013 RepID=UPI003666A072
RGPRVLGGPGVGTPLPEGEPAHPAPHDIEAAHGPAAEQAEGARGGDRAQLAEHVGQTGHPAQAQHAESAGHAGYAESAGHLGHGEHAGHGDHADHTDPMGHAEPAQPLSTNGHGFTFFPGAPEPGDPATAAGLPVATGGLDLFGSVRAEAEPAEPAQAAGTDGRGFSAFGHTPEPAPVSASVPVVPVAVAVAVEAHDAEPEAEPAAPEPDGADGHGPAGTGPAAAELPADRTPGADTADSASELPDEGTGERLPAAVPTYEEETGTGADAHHEHPHASYVLRVNGADRPVTGAWIGESLLYVLRERLGLAGAKDGCSQGECGACAVQVDGRLVASCLVPAATAAGSEVRTVEGLATNGELSDVQQALCRSGAVQCGFCVPGMAMTIHDLLEGNHAPSELETRQALCGNLCRCSGYAGVIDAVREVVSEREAAASEPVPQAPQAAQAPQALSEPRIPHQAAPGEGGIHHGGTA